MEPHRSFPWALAVAALSCVAAATSARAAERNGLFGGGSIGLGNTSPALCPGCDTGLAAELRLGAMVKPRLGVLAQFSSVASSPSVPSDTVGRHSALLAAVQYWPGSHIWLKAAAGAVGVLRRSEPGRYDNSTTHFGGLAGVGVEINPRSKVVVELALSDILSGDSSGTDRVLEYKSTVNSVIFTLGATFYRRR